MKTTSFFSTHTRRLFLCFLFLAAAVFLSACSGGGDRVSEINNVTYNAEKGEFFVKATLDSADVREFRGETVYLIEVPANSDLSFISTLIPIAQQKAAAEMSFSFSLKDGARTRLYSGFVLAVFDRINGYIPLCDVKYPSNPESLSQNTGEYPKFSSVKGLSVVSLSDAVALGVKHTVIRIPIEEYILPEAENALSFIFDGNPYYFNSQKISELDYKIKNLTGAEIEVFLEFTLNQPREALSGTMAELVSKSTSFQSDEQSKKDSFSISVSSGVGYRYMAALFEFFAERYTRADEKYGFAASYIIGNGANSELDDPKTLADRTEEYSKLLRIAAVALRSKYANGRVFVSLDHYESLDDAGGAVGTDQTADMPVPPSPLKTLFGAIEFLKALNLVAGDLDFGVALMPAGSAAEGEDASALTMDSLDKITAIIGDDCELIIYNYQLSSDNEREMALSYARAYLRAVEAGASAFIYNGQWDMTTGNEKSGLWSLGEDGGAFEKREIYDVFATIDSLDGALPSFLWTELGGKWKDLYEKYEKKIKSAAYSTGKASTIKNEDDKALKKAEETVIFDFSSGQSFDFFPSDSAQYIEIDRLGDSTALKSGLLPKYRGENVGVRKARIPFDTLKGALMIKAVLSADAGEGNTAAVTLALAQESEKGSIFHTSTAQIQASNPQTVYFDVRNAELDPSLGDVTLYIWVKNEGSRSLYYSEGIVDREQLLYIESISAFCKAGGMGVLGIVLIIILLAAVAYFAFVSFFGKGGKGGRGRRPSHPKNRPPQGRSNGSSGQKREGGQRRPQGNVANRPRPQRPAGYIQKNGLGTATDKRVQANVNGRANAVPTAKKRMGAETRNAPIDQRRARQSDLPQKRIPPRR